MKTLRKHSFFLLFAVVAATTGSAQTADEIIAKNLDAIGGKDLIASTKSIVLTSTISLEAMGLDLPSTTTIVADKAFKSETDFQGSKIITVVTDHGGWSVNPVSPAGPATPTATSEADLKAQKRQLNIAPFANYTANGGKAELVGKDTADYKLKLTNDDGLNAIYYVNMKTYLIDKAELHTTLQGQDLDVTLTFSDYRKLDNGVLSPFKIKQDLPQYSLTINVQKAEINKEIDPAIFDMPK